MTPNFTLQEFIRSDVATRHGIDNSPTPEVLANLQLLAEELERVRSVIAAPVRITSGYRSPALNTAVRGSKVSAHMSGRAADIDGPAWMNPQQVFEKLITARALLNFDKMILEFPPDGWVHYQIAKPGQAPRGELWVFRGGDYLPYRG